MLMSLNSSLGQVFLDISGVFCTQYHSRSALALNLSFYNGCAAGPIMKHIAVREL